MGSWIRLSDVFFRRIMYFFVFFCLGEIVPVRDELFEGVIGGCRLVLGMSLCSWDGVSDDWLR